MFASIHEILILLILELAVHGSGHTGFVIAHIESSVRYIPHRILQLEYPHAALNVVARCDMIITYFVHMSISHCLCFFQILFI